MATNPPAPVSTPASPADPSQPSDPGKPPRGADLKDQLRRLLALALMLGELVGSVFYSDSERWDDDREPEPDSTVWIAQITDPHLFEENKARAPAVPAEVENQKAFTEALEFLGTGRSSGGRLPDALVITGDFGLDTTFYRPRPPADPLTRAREVSRMVGLLRQSPVPRVFVVIGNNDLTQERPEAARLSYFHEIIAEVADSLQPRVQLRDLTECYGGGRARSCVADLPHGVRLIGFASASLKNQPLTIAATDTVGKFDSLARATTAPLYARWETSAVRTLETLVAQAARDGRHAVILTHVPDVDDPYTLKQIQGWLVTHPNEARRLQPAIWNVGPAIRRQWASAANDPAVIGVIAGHLHSDDREDYDPPYPNSVVAGNRLFISPPLAVKNQDASIDQARGLSMYRIEGRSVLREIAWRNPQTGFAQAQPAFAATPAPAASRAQAATPATSERAQETEPDSGPWGERLAVVLIAMLAAITGTLLAFSPRPPPPPWRDVRQPDPGWWLVRLRLGLAAAAGLAGLALALALFAETWDAREAVAIPYLFGFAATIFPAMYIVRSLERAWSALEPDPRLPPRRLLRLLRLRRRPMPPTP